MEVSSAVCAHSGSGRGQRLNTLRISRDTDGACVIFTLDPANGFDRLVVREEKGDDLLVVHR